VGRRARRIWRTEGSGGLKRVWLLAISSSISSHHILT
jgi:hypothetical protein